MTDDELLNEQIKFDELVNNETRLIEIGKTYTEKSKKSWAAAGTYIYEVLDELEISTGGKHKEHNRYYTFVLTEFAQAAYKQTL